MAQELTAVVTGFTVNKAAPSRGLLERGHKVRAVTRDPNTSQAKLLANCSNSEIFLLGKADSVGGDVESAEADSFCMVDCVEEDRGQCRFTARKQNINFALRLEGSGPFKQGDHIMPIQFVHEIRRVGIHVARRADHIAAVRQIDNQVCASSPLDVVLAVIVN